mgnify:CR=1 FL=1
MNKLKLRFFRTLCLLLNKMHNISTNVYLWSSKNWKQSIEDVEKEEIQSLKCKKILVQPKLITEDDEYW